MLLCTLCSDLYIHMYIMYMYTYVDRMPDTSRGATLLPADQLCMDAVRGSVPAHRARVGIHLRVHSADLVASARLGRTGIVHCTVHNQSGVCSGFH